MPAPLLLVGHFPPPRGGVAVHLDRLRAGLFRRGVPVRCCSFGNSDPAQSSTLIIRKHPLAFFGALLRGARILHYHTDEGDWKSAALMGIWCALRGQRYMLTLHSFRDHPFLRRSWAKALIRFTYRRADAIICISDNLRTELQQRLPVPADRVVVVPSFIAPSDAERRAQPREEFRSLAQRCRAIIAFNAFAPTVHDQQDLYGGDIVLDAFAMIRNEFPEAGLFMAYMRFDDSPHARALQSKAKTLGDRVVLSVQPDMPFIPELAASAVFVRATLNDGGPSLSVLEALSLGVFTAASDAVPRPPECALFANRDAASLAAVLRTILRDVRDGK